MTEDKPVSKSVDTIAVPREVLQGVRKCVLNAAATYRARKTAGKNVTETNVLIDETEEALASLDAVLSEGK